MTACTAFGNLTNTFFCRNVFVTGTYLNHEKILKRAVELHNAIRNEANAHAKSKSWRTFTMVQPWPTLFAKHTSKTDGNVLGLERFNKNMIREFLIFFIVPAIFFFFLTTRPCRIPF